AYRTDRPACGASHYAALLVAIRVNRAGRRAGGGYRLRVSHGVSARRRSGLLHATAHHAARAAGVHSARLPSLERRLDVSLPRGVRTPGGLERAPPPGGPPAPPTRR